MKRRLKENPVKNGTYVNAVIREMLSIILEGSMDGEMEEELGYSKADLRNKEQIIAVYFCFYPAID